MAINNYKDFLGQGLQGPQAFESQFPNAPKLSTQLANITAKLPNAPNFPGALPDLIKPPTLPKMNVKLPGGGPLGGGTLPRRTFITSTTDTFNPLPTQATGPGVNFLQRRNQVVSGSEVVNYK